MLCVKQFEQFEQFSRDNHHIVQLKREGIYSEVFIGFVTIVSMLKVLSGRIGFLSVTFGWFFDLW